MSNILITGGAGFIGSHLADSLIEQGHHVRLFDNLHPQVHGEAQRPPDYLNPAATFIRGDVTNPDQVNAALEGVEVVFHMASRVGVAQSMYEISDYVHTNVYGTAVLLNAIVDKRHSVRKVIVPASMTSYGEGTYVLPGSKESIRPPLRTEADVTDGIWELHTPEGEIMQPVPTPESAHTNNNSIYALTKHTQEEMTLMICARYGIPATVLRYFNVYGPRQSLSNPYTGVTAIFLSRIKNGNPPLIYEDGLQTRDFIHVKDVVRANILAMESDTANGHVYNVGTGIPTPIKTVAELAAKLLGTTIQPHITGQFRKGDIRHCFADITAIQHDLGFTPGISLEQGMAQLVEWSRSEVAVDHVDQATRDLTSRGLL
jgi:dTDP-L-rhamnose 4-epimerase